MLCVWKNILSSYAEHSTKTNRQLVTTVRFYSTDTRVTFHIFCSLSCKEWIKHHRHATNPCSAAFTVWGCKFGRNSFCGECVLSFASHAQSVKKIINSCRISVNQQLWFHWSGDCGRFSLHRMHAHLFNLHLSPVPESWFKLSASACLCNPHLYYSS